MGQGIITLIRAFLETLITFGKIKDKKLTEELVRVEGDIKVDKKQDKHLRFEPKILYYMDMKDAVEIEGVLYSGTKKEMLTLVTEDLGNILSRKQQKVFRKKIKDHTEGYFLLTVHPLTQH